MEETIQAWRQKKLRIDDDWLRRMGPAHFGHILSRYKDALIGVTVHAIARASSMS